MSLVDEEPPQSLSKKKRTHITRACDYCKRKKKRCNIASHEDTCAYCRAMGEECTFSGDRKKRGRPASKGFIEELKFRIQLLEKVIRKLCPDESALHDLIYPFDPEYAVLLTSQATPDMSSPMVSDLSLLPSSSENQNKNSVTDIIQKVASISLEPEDDSTDPEDVVELSEEVKSISIRPGMGSETRFYGQSTGVLLMQAVISQKTESSMDTDAPKVIPNDKRYMLFKRFNWEREFKTPNAKYTFPPSDLIATLTNAYFEHVNLIRPLLHRPTFERCIGQGLHYRDEGFGSVLLLVCAVGSRYTEPVDERTLVDESSLHYSTGWRYYNQVQIVKQRLFEPVMLYELQCYCLAAEFFGGCYAPQAVWILTGIGLRLAQDVGIHRRRIPREQMTVEDELWKRAFWVLVVTDRHVSVGIGRGRAILDDYIDADMPIECDDEFWESSDPTRRFVQPKDIPSIITAFNQHIRLSKILAFGMSTILSIKTKCWKSVSQDWDKHFITEVDSALNGWKSSLPHYLQWDPNRTDNRFFKLSGFLMTTFYYIQIVLHRPNYADSKHCKNDLHTSIALCTSAARSCSLVLEQQMPHMQFFSAVMQICAFNTALVLILNACASNTSIKAEELSTRQVETCMEVLRRSQSRWRSAGILFDVLKGLTATESISLASESNTELSMAWFSYFNSTPQASSDTCDGDRRPSTSVNEVDISSANPFLHYQMGQAKPQMDPLHMEHFQQSHINLFDPSSLYNFVQNSQFGFPGVIPVQDGTTNFGTYGEQTVQPIGNNTEAWDVPPGLDLSDEWNFILSNSTMY